MVDRSGTTARSTESLCPVCLRKVRAALMERGRDGRTGGTLPRPWSVAHPDLARFRPPTSLGVATATPARGVARAPPPARPAARPVRSVVRPLARSVTLPNAPGNAVFAQTHAQSTCTAVLEVTRRCNLTCPVCFADASPGITQADATLTDLTRSLRKLFVEQGRVNLQLSGGEPTMRSDLPQVVAAAREAGFTFVQLNTNGLRLAAEPGYAEALKDAGLVSVFLQFDGLTDETYRALRGRPLVTEKLLDLGTVRRGGFRRRARAHVGPGGQRL